jgi:hypothetical protein
MFGMEYISTCMEMPTPTRSEERYQRTGNPHVPQGI